MKRSKKVSPAPARQVPGYMKNNRIQNLSLTVSLFLLVASLSGAQENKGIPPELKDVDIIEHLGEIIPQDIIIVTDQGDTVEISSLLHQGKPIVLNLAYYQCPMLCNLVLNGVAETMGKLDWNAGSEFQALVVSINPEETHELAADKKANYIDEFKASSGREFNSDGWIFATASEHDSRKLADALGFEYYRVPETGEYAHAAATFVLSEDGMIARYLYGVSYRERDLRLALLEASEGKFGSAMDKLLLFCYRYDPGSRGYVMFAVNVMKIGGALTVVLIALLVGGLIWRERRRHPKTNVARTT